MSQQKALLLLVPLSFTILHAQETVRQGQDAPRVRNAVIREEHKATEEEKALQSNLLDKAYGLSKNLSDSDRAFLLGRIASAASRNDAERAGKVASEVFSITSNLKPGMIRNQSETNAVMAVADTDLPGALQLLLRMEAPPAGSQAPDMRMGVAAMLFQRYWQKDGMDAVETIASTARRLGESGSYPYMAMGPVIRQVGRKDADRAQTLMNEALAYITQRPKDRMGADSIAGFLSNNRDRIPAPLMKQILEKLVKEALDSKDDNGVVMASFSNDKGQKAEIKGAASLLLFQVLPLIQDIDPEWAKKLEKENEQLRLAAEMARSESGQSEVSVMAALPEGDGNRNAPPPAAVMEEMKAMRVDELASRDPQEALKRANEISSPSLRAASTARIAGEIAQKDPEQADKLVKEAKKALAETKEPGDKLRILTGLAQAQAAMKDKEAFSQTLEAAFGMGEELFRKSVDSNPNRPIFAQQAFEPMSRVVQASIKLDPAITLQKLEALRSELLQANLLVSAAAGLNPGGERRPGVRIEINN